MTQQQEQQRNPEAETQYKITIQMGNKVGRLELENATLNVLLGESNEREQAKDEEIAKLKESLLKAEEVILNYSEKIKAMESQDKAVEIEVEEVESE